MSDYTGQNKHQTLTQFAFLILILVIFGGLFWLFTHIGKAPEGTREITYRVTGTTTTITITFTQSDGSQTKPFDDKPPWQKKLYINESRTVILTATNPVQIGKVTCEILLDGQVWKSQSIASPSDKCSCAGIVPKK